MTTATDQAPGTIKAYLNKDHGIVAMTDGVHWYGAFEDQVRAQAAHEGWESEEDFAQDFQVEIAGRVAERGNACDREELEFHTQNSFGITLDDFEQVPVTSLLPGQA